MTRTKLLLALALLPAVVFAQPPKQRFREVFGTNQPKPQVLLLGVFHFAGEQVDAHTTPENMPVDMLSPKRQQEITALVEKLAAFKPTKIAIELPPQYRRAYDSLYRAWCRKTLKAMPAFLADEKVQLAFRLAKRMGLTTLYPVDAQAFRFRLSPADSLLTYEKYKDQVIPDNDDWDQRYALESRHDDTLKFRLPLKDYLRYLNDPEKQAKTVGRWLITTSRGTNIEPIGADGFITRYFNRNVRIYSNIQRIIDSPNDRVLVIYGATHMYFLKTIFAASPQYRLNDITPYLK